jgi:hypothetical protein
VSEGWDPQEVFQQNERLIGQVERQRAQLGSQEQLITKLRAESERLREIVGVLRYRLWAREKGVEVPRGRVVMQHGWKDGDTSYRAMVLAMANGPGDHQDADEESA